MDRVQVDKGNTRGNTEPGSDLDEHPPGFCVSRETLRIAAVLIDLGNCQWYNESAGWQPGDIMANGLDFFTWQYLGTMAGATLATVLLCNVLHVAFGWRPQWLGLLIACLIQMAVWWFVSDRSISSLVLALINGGVVYLAAVGGNQIAASRQPEARAAGDRPAFWSSWWS